MPYRNLVLANNQVYHLLSRGVAKQPIFKEKRDYDHILDLINFYRHDNLPFRFSHLRRLNNHDREKIWQDLEKEKDFLVEIITFCLMPNHIHLLVKQLKDKGISTFMSNLQNSYARFFNIKYKRIGALFQAMFRAIMVESDEQLLHVSRYLHLKPVTSFLIETNQLSNYPWTSFPDYMGKRRLNFVSPSLVLDFFPKKEKYQEFVFDQADYQRELGKMKHLFLD